MCNLALKSKDVYKTYEMGHDEDRGFKCIFCLMTEWEVRSLSSVRSALTPPLMQALCSGPSKHALVRCHTNVDSVHIVGNSDDETSAPFGESFDAKTEIWKCIYQK
ncbi:hypothetical protein Q9233_004311 [Columba guinea]|nr:hypothetical protein Q9233_004311 [Columba guinea]